MIELKLIDDAFKINIFPGSPVHIGTKLIQDWF